ncbi:hypothetical protein JMJ35_006321 [Cladonia borealis]|uniref:L-type lectin-like domain-containing protein n=1 Tax=Cladonia borealis TaxID=184061 RepID=A0AA39R1S4_9LECA|nr:hypothetical protein JMJ35_006321 [Cladonia borealis]
MHFFYLLSLLAASASAQYLVESSSFGHNERISPNNDGNIPGWLLSGDGGNVPQIMSDRVILTPSYPGNQRGALWADARVSQAEWIAQFDFRASGPERGGGNLQLWYAKDGPKAVGTSSIYTAGQFDGFVLVIDSYGGRGGSIRGFMNDGSLDYKNYHSVDSLAFGHCDYSYRNLGRPSKLQIRQEGTTFEVIIDDKLCMSTDKIRMPQYYNFGITAASAENPDSFELYKFLLFTSGSVTREEPRRAQTPYGEQSNINANTPPDTPAPSVDQTAQFQDLHNRLQTLTHSIDSLYNEIRVLADKSEGRHQELSRNVISPDRLDAIDTRLHGIETIVRGYQGQFSGLENSLKDTHSSLAENLPKHMGDLITTSAPRMGLLIFVFIGVQLLLAGSYVIYKRRRANGPKKYL